MASTPNPNLQPPSLLKSKLPIKRKNPDFNTNPNLVPDLDNGGDGEFGDTNKPPPFKFQRLWTEPDEIRLLEHLLDSSPHLSFPKDLNLFYSTFPQTTSHPYTKSQLSEKLRRLRKKFRIVSARMNRGLKWAMMPPHDRELFDLSKMLWGHEDSPASPFLAGCGSLVEQENSKFNLVGVEVGFSPTLEISNQGVVNLVGEEDDRVFEENHEVFDGGSFLVDNDCDAKLSEVNVELDNAVVIEQELSIPSGGDGGGLGGGQGGFGGGIVEVVAKTVMSVFDDSLKEVRTVLVSDLESGQSVVDNLEKRWREQRVAELDVLGRRLRLVLEHSLLRQ